MRNLESPALMDYICEEYHIYLKTALPKLSDLVTTILRVHGPQHLELFEVHSLFHELKIGLDQHLIKEEVILFPLLKDQASQGEYGPILAAIEKDFVQIDSILAELQEVTNDYQAPGDGCGTYDLTYAKLAELEQNTKAHLEVEKDILFSGFR